MPFEGRTKVGVPQVTPLQPVGRVGAQSLTITLKKAPVSVIFLYNDKNWKGKWARARRLPNDITLGLWVLRTRLQFMVVHEFIDV